MFDFDNFNDMCESSMILGMCNDEQVASQVIDFVNKCQRDYYGSVPKRVVDDFFAYECGVPFHILPRDLQYKIDTLNVY